MDIIKILFPAAIAFFIGIAITPFISGWLYRNKMWKQKSGKVDLSGNATVLFNQLHKEREVNTPRMGGIIIWGSVILTVIILWVLSLFYPNETTGKLNFLSRAQTWLPLFTLIAASLLGLVDDWMQIRGSTDHVSGGLSLRKRMLVVLAISFVGAWWFYFKLDVSSVGIPFMDALDLGIWFIPFFMIVTLGLFSGAVIDGLDGLAGGVMAIIFGSYAWIAFFQHQIDLAAFCLTVVGGILAFLWFNIPPARFYMSETGILGLILTLSVVAFMTDTLGEGHGVLALAFIALPLWVTSLSVIIQILSKKFRKRKVFLIAPLHHHFEAMGWPAYKVTMRYWVISMIFSFLGLIVALLG
ncbi:MAG: hypothetical protein Q8P49_01115 [Candidatus Liptonbacteria bacterium]|nr:hypothetical protein [Candidatus Liptonbacteria bacterium]